MADPNKPERNKKWWRDRMRANPTYSAKCASGSQCATREDGKGCKGIRKNPLHGASALKCACPCHGPITAKMDRAARRVAMLPNLIGDL